MSDLQRKKNILHQLVKARNAVKRKYNLLKFGRENFEKVVGETFKPIVDPLQKLVTETTKTSEHFPLENKSTENPPTKQLTEDDNESISSTSTIQEDSFNDEIDTTQIQKNDTTFETAGEDEEEDPSKDSSHYFYMLDPRYSKNIDKIYGVRKDKGKYTIGNSLIHFKDTEIKLNDKTYTRTPGLLELLITKYPNRELITTSDLKNYKEILETSSAHKRQFRPDESIRVHNSKKYTDFIAPLFTVISNVNKRKSTSKEGGRLKLPRYKIARRNTTMDYIYWDDPNELVDRLRLLMAETSAGNSSHTNEIHSIIEELREAGYIY